MRRGRAPLSLTGVLDRVELLTSRPGCLSAGNHWIGVWLDTRASLKVAKKKNLLPLLESKDNFRCSSRWPSHIQTGPSRIVRKEVSHSQRARIRFKYILRNLEIWCESVGWFQLVQKILKTSFCKQIYIRAENVLTTSLSNERWRHFTLRI